MIDSDVFVMIVTLFGMLIALVNDQLRPGLVLFSVVVVFLSTGILSPSEAVAGFSNRGMLTVAMLFLVSEGVRRSGVLSKIVKKILPTKKTNIPLSQLQILPVISFLSGFLNNTPVVIIFAPIVKRWAEKIGFSPTKFLIPLSYATILGGASTLIGSSTNLLVHGMMLNEGLEGFRMFELGKIGGIIALVGLCYLILFSGMLLPATRKEEDDENKEAGDAEYFLIEVMLGVRFPGINRSIKRFDFFRRYGVTIRHIKRNGEVLAADAEDERFKTNDTLVLWADASFVKAWGDSSIFVFLSDTKQEVDSQKSRQKRYLSIALLVMMIVGGTIGEMPFMNRLFPNFRFDMFFFVSLTTVVMAWTKLFPPKKYTKFISWDILLTIASALAISTAIENSGFSALIASFLVEHTVHLSPHVLLALIFILTNIITELITNNAAAALVFPIAHSVSAQLGVDPLPFIVTICIAASASFCTPIGYQTNLIVQGLGNYKFSDYLRVGLPLNLIAFILSVGLIPLIWEF